MKRIPPSKPAKVNVMGMVLDEWQHASCVAHFGIGKDWATLYDIRSSEQGRGHATELMSKAKKFYEQQGKKVGGAVALNGTMKRLYQKLDYHEYEEDSIK